MSVIGGPYVVFWNETLRICRKEIPCPTVQKRRRRGELCVLFLHDGLGSVLASCSGRPIPNVSMRYLSIRRLIPSRFAAWVWI